MELSFDDVTLGFAGAAAIGLSLFGVIVFAPNRKADREKAELERAAHWYNRQREELHKFMLDCVALRQGKTPAPPDATRRIWVTGTSRNPRIHWRDDCGNTFDRQERMNFDLRDWASRQLGLHETSDAVRKAAARLQAE
jgi:hypothetical protein